MTKVKAANVQAIINWSIEPAQAIVIKNARQIGLKIPIFQSHGFGNIKYVEAAGAAAEGVLFPAGRLLVADKLPKNHPQKAVLVKYKKDYESKYKDEASTFGGHAYDAFLILVKAIEKAKSTDKEKVRTAIENLKGVVGTAGYLQLLPVGPQRPRRGRLRDADREEGAVRRPVSRGPIGNPGGAIGSTRVARVLPIV